jgi:putative proteasome-type protease
MVSFDSTVRSNLSVALPLDMLFYRRDGLRVDYRKRIQQDDPYYRQISDGWSEALKAAFKRLPDFRE